MSAGYPDPSSSLYQSQVKVKKAETDLVIDQLHEVFLTLGKDKISVSKFEKRLEDIRHKWDEIKKAQPQVKSDVEPIQANESDRIKKDIEKFAGKVRNYKMDIRKRSFFKYATGSEAAYKDLDTVAADLSGLRKECEKQYELASIFEFPQVYIARVKV